MEKDNHLFSDYFTYLSSRGNENYLSDIIAAACNSCAKFKKLFLDFVFPEEDLMSKCSSEIEREVWSEDGSLRFDFYFTTNTNEEYIIENKIYDPHDHYDSYTSIYKEDHIGFIANYDVSSILYTHKHTWKNFYTYLKNNLELFTEEEFMLVEGIINYIKGACGIMEERKFDLNKLIDLGYFMQLFKEILKEKGFEINNQAKGSSEERIGFWCYKESGYWFGLYLYTDAEEGFSLWGGIYDYKIKQNSVQKLKYASYDQNDTTNNCCWFKLKEEQLNKLSDDISILKNFIDEVENVK